MIVVALLFLGLGTAVDAAADLTARERSCQVGRAHVVYDLIVASADCLRRCHAGPAADCLPADGDGVAACLAAVKTRALRGVFGRSCRRDCPEGYDGCTPAVATGEVDYTSGLIAGFAPLVFCTPDATRDEGRCRNAVANASARFARAYGRCFARSQRDGGDAGGPPDARTLTCTERAARRAVDAVDARCEPQRGGAKPPCYGDRTGAGWVALVRTAVDAGRPVIFCASPSGAFVEEDVR